MGLKTSIPLFFWLSLQDMRSFLPCLLLIFLLACSDKYQAYKTQYQFKSAAGRPDYTQLDYWAAHPWKKDPADSIPAALQNEKRDSSADVFFLHPTTFTKKKDRQQPNALIDDPMINAKTDYSSILYQASVFNADCRVFAPRYRQAHIWNFYREDKVAAEKAFDLAYADLRESFIYYLEHWNKGRPVIIAAHSQGSLLAERLLKEFFENKALKKQLVAAYIIGWPVPKKYFTDISICADSLQTGCICSWRTLRRNFVPTYLRNEKGDAYVTNPLTWTTGNEYASRKLNRGSVLTNFEKIYPHTTDAQISNGLLYVKKPKFPWSFFFFTRNYHIADINLYYLNIRQNIRQRIAAFQSK